MVNKKFAFLNLGVVFLFFLAFTLLFGLRLASAACTNTSNLSLCKPAIADSGWGTNLNSNFDKIDDVFGTGAGGHDHTGTAGEGPTIPTAGLQANSVNGTKIALGSDAQGDVMYYDGTDWVRLAPGTSGNFLKTQGASANPVWASASLQSTAIAFTRTAAAGTGDQAITGAGFTPTVVFVNCIKNAADQASWGFSDDAVADHEIAKEETTGSHRSSDGLLVYIVVGADEMKAVMKTLDSDGFTVTWTKAGAGHDVQCEAMALR